MAKVTIVYKPPPPPPAVKVEKVVVEMSEEEAKQLLIALGASTHAYTVYGALLDALNRRFT